MQSLPNAGDTHLTYESAKDDPMKNSNASLRQAAVRAGWATALGLASIASMTAAAHAAITVPAVPATIRVSDDNTVYLVGHAIGTQNYICSKSGSAVKYVLFTPEATLFDDDDKQIITHYFSPNPSEPNANPLVIADGVVRATWQHKDTSTVWASGAPSDGGNSSLDHEFVAEDAIAWVKLKVLGDESGPTGGDKLTLTTFIQRLNTQGGLPPSTGCASLDDVGNPAFVPYTADYFFYKAK